MDCSLGTNVMNDGCFSSSLQKMISFLFMLHGGPILYSMVCRFCTNIVVSSTLSGETYVYIVRV